MASGLLNNLEGLVVGQPFQAHRLSQNRWEQFFTICQVRQKIFPNAENDLETVFVKIAGSLCARILFEAATHWYRVHSLSQCGEFLEEVFGSPSSQIIVGAKSE